MPSYELRLRYRTRVLYSAGKGVITINLEQNCRRPQAAQPPPTPTQTRNQFDSGRTRATAPNTDLQIPTPRRQFFSKGSGAGQIKSIHRPRETQPEKLADFQRNPSRPGLYDKLIGHGGNGHGAGKANPDSLFWCKAKVFCCVSNECGRNFARLQRLRPPSIRRDLIGTLFSA